MRKSRYLFVSITLLMFWLAACKKEEADLGSKAAEGFLESYFSMETPEIELFSEKAEAPFENSSLQLEMPEYYQEHFTEKCQEQMLLKRYTNSMYQLAEQNGCTYQCEEITLKTQQTESPVTYHFQAEVSDEEGNTYRCTGDICVVLENGVWRIEGFYPSFDSF